MEKRPLGETNWSDTSVSGSLYYVISAERCEQM